MSSIGVAVAGCRGRMGSAVVQAVTDADDMHVVCGIDPADSDDAIGFPIYKDIDDALANEGFDVLVDFTRPDVVEMNIRAALEHDVNCVIGTTGLSEEMLSRIYSESGSDACLFFAPNFTTGAVLMMQFARAAAPFFPQAEIIEFHHCNKLDSPSGTAMQTAKLISDARDGKASEAPGKETEVVGAEGARGALIDGIPVHSVRSSGYVASQEVIFGSYGQTLTIKHDSWDRGSYMPGVLLGIRSVMDRTGIIIGLDQLM